MLTGVDLSCCDICNLSSEDFRPRLGDNDRKERRTSGFSFQKSATGMAEPPGPCRAPRT